MKYLLKLRRFSSLFLMVLLGGLILTGSVIPLGDHTNKVRVFTRQQEFDYVNWTLDALQIKFFEAALGTGNYLSNEDRCQLVIDYLILVDKVQQIDYLLSVIYADSSIENPKTIVTDLLEEYTQLNAQLNLVSPVVEEILQGQISFVIDDLGLDLGGQPIPPVLYHSTPLPLALIVSPRDIIRQDKNISLSPDMTVDEQIALEKIVDHSLNVSSLVVHIGGVGVYPTMIQQTISLNWLSEVIAHEWVHNFLTLRPLGANYMTSDVLRTMNETTASIAGKEIGRAVLEAFYPELIPQQSSSSSVLYNHKPLEPLAFNFRDEMHTTRIHVDQLLAEGKIEEAEEYMEERRKVFWENGYINLRKLNQAYFAFYGAYADIPGGAAPEKDPVGEAVRTLRAQSDSLAEFLNRISWMYSFGQLQKAISEAG